MDQEEKKPRKCASSFGENLTGRIKERILLYLIPMIFNVILKDLDENLFVQYFFFIIYPPRIRIRMDIFGIPDPDPHKKIHS